MINRAQANYRPSSIGLSILICVLTLEQTEVQGQEHVDHWIRLYAVKLAV